MNCRGVAHDLTELQEGNLPLVRRTLLRAHLVICPACRLYVRQMAATKDALHEANEPLSDDASRAIAERALRARK